MGISLDNNAYTIISYNNKFGFVKLDPTAIIPTRAHSNDLGFDLHCLEPVDLLPNKITKVATGIACEFPTYVGGLIRDRSSVATKLGLVVVAGVIDPSYQGEIIVALYNTSMKPVQFNRGDRIAQMILMPVIIAESIELKSMPEPTERGTAGFGSTGV
jgi:dUTP pyrophosphatase